MPAAEVHGPIDFVLLEFPGDSSLDAAASALVELIDRGLVALYDLLVVRKDADGSVSGIELDTLDGSFAVFVGARSGLLGDDDVAQAADALEPNTTAVLLMYENTWARPFVAAALDAGGQLVASTRIPAADLIEALDALDD